jgi:cyclic di-GMP phosphodiesterase
MNMLELAVTMDSQGMVREWAPSAENIFGFEASYAVGRSLGDLIVPAPVRPFHEAGLRRYVETREPHCVGNVVEIEAVHQQGHPVPIQMKIVPREVGEELLFEAHISENTP